MQFILQKGFSDYDLRVKKRRRRFGRKFAQACTELQHFEPELSVMFEIYEIINLHHYMDMCKYN